MIVSHALQAVFISNPKTGSRSIGAALEQFQDEPQLNELSLDGLYTRGHVPAYALRDILGPSAWQSYFKFAFVRNPWDWFVSQHFYNLQKHGRPYDANEQLSAQDILRTYRFLQSYRGAPWVESACQNTFVCDQRGKVLVDFLGHFENLNNDFAEIGSRIGFNIELPHVNVSAHRYYRNYFNTKTREQVRQLYECDIKIFAYDF
jgi:hypothetical protein